jgi:hypothetical protein
LNSERVTDDEFAAYFGDPGRNFLAALSDFKAVAKDFYASDAGEAFVNAYEARKGSRKVNNPLRRKEAGNYFKALRGYKSEHLFAELYVQMYAIGMNNLRSDGSTPDWPEYLEAMRFILGMDGDILTLNAIAGDDGRVVKVENSYLSGAYAGLRRVLVPECEFALDMRPGSSMIDVTVSYGGETIKCLNLAIWKDATIQYKLDSSIESSASWE